jgi:tRNA-binding EMAP/Myf-like protein
MVSGITSFRNLQNMGIQGLLKCANLEKQNTAGIRRDGDL